MGRHDQVSRILTVLRLLEGNPRGFTIKQLHGRITQDFDVNERNLRRDLDALENLGYDLERGENPDPADRSKIIKLNPTVKVTRQLVLSPGELLALYLAQKMLIPLKETAFYQDLEKVFRQIDLLLKEKDREHLKEIASEVRFEPSPRWGLGIDPEVVDTVRAACTNSQVLEFRYKSATDSLESHRRVGPHFLYFAKGSLYLICEDFKDNKVKVFAIPRMKEAVMTDALYEGKKQEPEDFFKGSFGVFNSQEPQTVKLVFSAEVAPYVRERRWHETQRIVNRSDGSSEMHLEVGITPDFVQWVLSFGSRVEAVEPINLRQQVLETAESVVAAYRAPGKSFLKKPA